MKKISKNLSINLMRLFVLSLVLFSCSTDLHITMPEGPAGEDGLSAYEIWKEAVIDGTIDWDKEHITEVYFFLYLKGEDGQDGESAYEIWIKEVEKGLEDPHNPGSDWPKDMITIQNFWQFLAGEDGQDGRDGRDGRDGKDGQSGQDGQDGQDGEDGEDGEDGLSAYELWKKDVCGVDSLNNPHYDPSIPDTDPRYNIYYTYLEYWPCDGTNTIEEFWHYLTGKDGESDYIIDDQIIELGVPNVLVRYYMQDSDAGNFEYVNASNGKVKYTVYDKNGNVYPNAEVEIVIGNVTFNGASDGDGNIYISKDYLPESTSYTLSCKVSGEETPENTYIPVCPQVKVSFTGSSLKITDDAESIQLFNYLIKRSMDGGTSWEDLPVYLSYDTVTMALYDVEVISNTVNTDNRTLIRSEKMTSATVYTNMKTGEILLKKRPIKKTDYFTPYDSLAWNEEDQYAIMSISNLYGEEVFTENIMQIAPIQPCPLIEILEIEEEKIDKTNNIWMGIDITGGFVVSNIDTSLIFKEDLALDEDSFDKPCFVPVEDNEILTSKKGGFLRIYSYKSFGAGPEAGSAGCHSNFVDINNKNVNNNKDGFTAAFIYDRGSIQVPESIYFFRAFYYSTRRTGAREWQFIINPTNLKGGVIKGGPYDFTITTTK